MSVRHSVTPGRAVQRLGFQLRQAGLAVTEDAAFRVVRASLHYGQQGASHNALGWQMQHVAEIHQPALANSHYQVVHRHRCRCSVVLTGDGMQTAAVKTVDHAHHRSCEAPGQNGRWVNKPILQPTPFTIGSCPDLNQAGRQRTAVPSI